ncbi:MAG: hypothetical protein IJ521_02320, partial [Schwartzia sp.]|nr:hypothetical protein [Schwartzia sp. (in: firmicutes)]
NIYYANSMIYRRKNKWEEITLKLQSVKITIPRQKDTDQQIIETTFLPRECEKPVHQVLVSMLGRLYYYEKKVNLAS